MLKQKEAGQGFDTSNTRPETHSSPSQVQDSTWLSFKISRVLRCITDKEAKTSEKQSTNLPSTEVTNLLLSSTSASVNFLQLLCARR